MKFPPKIQKSHQKLNMYPEFSSCLAKSTAVRPGEGGCEFAKLIWQAPAGRTNGRVPEIVSTAAVRFLVNSIH